MSKVVSIEPRIVFGTVDPYLFSPDRNFGCKAKSRVSVEAGTHGETIDSVPQESTYLLAVDLMEESEFTRVVNFGTDPSGQFHKSFEEIECLKILVGIECPKDGRNADESSIRANLSSYSDLNQVLDNLNDDQPTLFILADIIATLLDPRKLLRTIKILLKKNPKNRLLLSSPDRNRVDGKGYLGVPSNPRHFRDWTLEELGLALRSSGFTIESASNAPQKMSDLHNRNFLLVLSSNDLSQETFYEYNSLPASASRLMVTQEHAKTESSGGIGTYVDQVGELLDSSSIILFAGSKGIQSQKFLSDNGWFHTSFFVGNGVNFPGPEIDYEAVLAGVEHLVFLYESLKIVEYADFIGLGYRVAQAKKANLLPPDVRTICYCHGNTFYLDNAQGDIGTSRDLLIDVKERIGIELSDYVFFPSMFLADLYINKQGLSIENWGQLPYPVKISGIQCDPIDYRMVDTLVFYGRATPQKGFDIFLEALKILDTQFPAAMSQISRIILAGVLPKDVSDDIRLDPRIETFVGSRDWATNLVSKNAARGIAILPYRGDNQPLSIYEMIQAGMRFISTSEGGIPEMIPGEFHPRVLSSIVPKELAGLILETLAEPAHERFSFTNKLRQEVSKNLETAHLKYVEAYGKVVKNNVRIKENSNSGLTVVITNFNGVLGQIEDALRGVKNLTFPNIQIIVADDASSSNHISELKDLLNRLGIDSASLLISDSNIGLPGLRNLALSSIQTEFAMFLDNDNVAHNSFADVAIGMLEENENLACVTSWMDTFNEDANWNEKQPLGTYEYRPVGADLGVGFLQNEFGDSSGVYRVSTLKQIGGWDASTRAKWEDWQIFIRLANEGFEIGLIPKVMISYRVRQDSMARTYADFPALLRLASSIPIPRNQRYSMMRALRHRPELEGRDQIHYEVEQLRFELTNIRNELAGIYSSRSWKTTQFLIKRLKSSNLLFLAARKSLGFLIWIRKKVKKFLFRK